MRGALHTEFETITIHTAKCDLCNRHNRSEMFRCTKCGRQCCKPCWDDKGGDGRHQLHNKQQVTYTGPKAEPLPPVEGKEGEKQVKKGFGKVMKERNGRGEKRARDHGKTSGRETGSPLSMTDSDGLDEGSAAYEHKRRRHALAASSSTLSPSIERKDSSIPTRHPKPSIQKFKPANNSTTWRNSTSHKISPSTPKPTTTSANSTTLTNSTSHKVSPSTPKPNITPAKNPEVSYPSPFSSFPPSLSPFPFAQILTSPSTQRSSNLNRAATNTLITHPTSPSSLSSPSSPTSSKPNPTTTPLTQPNPTTTTTTTTPSHAPNPPPENQDYDGVNRILSAASILETRTTTSSSSPPSTRAALLFTTTSSPPPQPRLFRRHNTTLFNQQGHYHHSPKRPFT
ncbi:MAG: hypothetical protein Q9186_005043 [Xanthomendoza sp. 1 TL-2023]